MEEGGGEEDEVEGAEEEVRGDEEATKVASTQTWSLWQGTGALEEVGTGGRVAKRATGEVEKEGTLLGVKEAIVKNEMAIEDTQGIAEVGREVVTGPGTLEVKAGKWRGVTTTAGGRRREGQGRRRGMTQGGQEKALMKQGVETKAMEEGMGGATSQAGYKVSSRKQGKVVGQGVEKVSQGKLNLTRSGRNNKRRSQQGSRWFCTCVSLKLSQV